jgi:ABC-type uncharacterized transport system involved in gliding motility auxiliary subunit
VTLVSDIDCLADEIFYIRTLGRDNPAMDIKFDFDNVPFVLNILDELTGDRRFIEIRKHRPKYRSLERIERETNEAKKNVEKVREETMKKFEKFKKDTQEEIDKKSRDITSRGEEDSRNLTGEWLMTINSAQQKFKRDVEILALDNQRQIENAERDQQDRLNEVQLLYKLLAVLLPPILPLFVALSVFVYRRRLEREGVASSRLK